MFNKVTKHWRKLFPQAIILIVWSTCTAMIWTTTYAAAITDGLRVYQNTPNLSEEHKQNIADDLSRFNQADNLWDVLRDEFSLPHYENNPRVQEKIEWFMNNQDFLLRSVTRASPYLYYILQQVKTRHLPAELVLLPIVESGYNPSAISTVGAAGIWQLMPNTASGLGIQQDWWYDGRRDVISSTGAALNYLAYLQSFFDGNWLLAMAAYNTGEGNVGAAIRRNIRDGYNTDFWSLPLAQETKNYVPSILALAVIISNPSKYGVVFPQVPNAPYLAKFNVQTKINLKLAAQFAGLSYKRLLQLNPGFYREAAKAPYKLVLPIENVEQFSENLVRSPYNDRSSMGWLHYRMKSGDTLLSVAKKFKTTTDEIRKLNRLVKANPKRGTNLLIPDSGGKTTELASAESDDEPTSRSAGRNTDSIASRVNKKLTEEAEYKQVRQYKLKPGDTIYMVRNYDTLEKIAKKFHISTNALKTANKLRGRQILPGKNLVIPTLTNTTKLTASSKNMAVSSHETVYMVKHGDTIGKIAKRFHTSPASIRLANLIDDKSLLEGVKLVIPLPVRG